MKKVVDIIEFDSIKTIATQLVAMQNQLITQFSKLGINQYLAQVNVMYLTLGWCEICSNRIHSKYLYGANPKFVVFAGNAHTPTYMNSYNQKYQTQANFTWGNNHI